MKNNKQYAFAPIIFCMFILQGKHVIMKLKLKKFDMATIRDDQVVVLIGKRDTGKSFLCKDLLYYKQDIPVGTVISATESANKFYSYMVPNLFIHDEYTADIIANVVKRQKIIMKKVKSDEKKYGESKIDPRTFLILDDCLYDSSWIRDKNIRSIFMNGRHLKIFFAITMQYPLGIPPNLRTNIDYIFILRENIIGNRKRIYENYAGMFPTFEAFSQCMNQTTEDYECLVIHNNAKSNRIEDQVFWYKADSHDTFRIGAKEFWNMQAEDNDDSDMSSEDDMCDVSAFVSKKKGPKLNVQKGF